MQAKLSDVLQKAKLGGYAVGAFNTSNLEITQAIIEAASDLNAPVIVQTSEKAIDFAGLEEISSIVRIEAIKARVPVVLHLDHGKNLELIDHVLKFGYGSVMIDSSVFPENQRRTVTKKVVENAHNLGISVEGERDSLSGKEDYIASINSHLSNPKDAKKFVEETGIDAFAVSIGNAHGGNLPGEHLDLELLEKIKQHVSIPLVLHGASSTPEESIREAIKRGITKINIDTDLRHAFTDDLRALLKKDPDVYDPRDLMKVGKDAIKRVVKEKIRLFGSAGKA